jgi:hypothetical protein
MVAAPRTRRLLRRSLIILGALTAILTLAGQALAAVPITTVAEDPYTNTNAWHQALVEPDTYSFGSTIVSAFQGGGRFEDGGSDNIGWATSTNSGATWTSGELPSTTQYSNPPGPWNRISDPAVSYDPKRNVWMIAGIAIDNSLIGRAVVVSRSLDGGLTWQAPVTISTAPGNSFWDKSWIGCDTSASSPFYGNCYAQWDDAFAGQAFKMSRSTDGGLTWSPSTVPNQSVIGGQILVQPNGTVVVVIDGSGIDSYVSTNGGVSYTGPFNVGSLSVHGATNMRDGSGLPTAEIDGGGTVYAAWTDCRFRTACQADDIVYSTSTDGMTWSAVKKVPLVGGNSQLEIFLAGIGVDHATQGSTAHVGVAFYFMPTNSCNSNTCKINAGFVSSTNAGTSWGTPVKLFGAFKQTWLPNPGGYFLGDYISTSYGSNGKAYPVIANATNTGTACTVGIITSCNEDMVVPTNGLAALGGNIPAVTKVLSSGTNPRPQGRHGTAF